MAAATIWLTGMSGTGKTTLASSLAKCLHTAGNKIALLDSDVVRPAICYGLGFSKLDKQENILRLGGTAQALNALDIYCCVAVISPLDAVREVIRRDIPRFLVYCTAPIDLLRKRDVKGLYASFDRGEISQIAGLDTPYEVPRNPDITVSSDGQETPNDSVSRIVKALNLSIDKPKPDL